MDPRIVTPAAGDLLLLVGTTKGAFLLHTGADRRDWRLAGPFCQGDMVYAMLLDQRAGRQRLWASAHNEQWATELVYSDDYGRSWTQPEVPLIAFPADTELALERIWQLVPGADDDTLHAGVAPAALFSSRDGGATWALNRGLHDHPHRLDWNPGYGGLCLHTVLPHPLDTRRMLVAISAAGVYRTDDGGATWTASNEGIRADFQPEKYPVFGQCVHKVARDAADPERLFLQNHGGLYRSDDGGRTWIDIGAGVPSDFGFPVVTHPRRGQTAYVVPLSTDMRVVPDGALAVYRTQDGQHWQPLRGGLPQYGAFETVLRDGLAIDALDPAGLYFGTRSGKVYGSADEGESWQAIWQDLPPVVCVKAHTVGAG